MGPADGDHRRSCPGSEILLFELTVEEGVALAALALVAGPVWTSGQALVSGQVLQVFEWVWQAFGRMRQVFEQVQVSSSTRTHLDFLPLFLVEPRCRWEICIPPCSLKRPSLLWTVCLRRARKPQHLEACSPLYPQPFRSSSLVLPASNRALYLLQLIPDTSTAQGRLHAESV